jgi:charged multivesicular body protein 5
MKKMRPGPAKASVQKRALAILKQKKMYEKQKESTMNQQFNVDQIMFAQDSMKETVSTVSAMKDANKALKKQFKQVEHMPLALYRVPLGLSHPHFDASRIRLQTYY